MNVKILIGALLFFMIVLGSWFFVWPLVECAYAWSWEPLTSNSHKLNLFFIGGLVFWVAFYKGFKYIGV